jgi:hypothetical protein
MQQKALHFYVLKFLVINDISIGVGGHENFWYEKAPTPRNAVYEFSAVIFYTDGK